jgi:hypothetical protein
MATAIKQMKSSDITRESIVIPNFSEATETLAATAESVLGYKGFSKAKEEAKELGRLAAVLATLGIEVLNREDVKRYQREKQNDVARITFERWLGETGYRSSYYGPNWRTTEISEYEKPIPQFVLNKAIEIKQACPEATFKVEWLEENPDPFLHVQLLKDGSKYSVEEEYVIEVWNEPKFEVTL